MLRDGEPFVWTDLLVQALAILVHTWLGRVVNSFTRDELSHSGLCSVV